MIIDKWDGFDKSGMKRHIRGYEFSIDIGTSKPICCKQPRYGPHEARVIGELVDKLDAQGLTEADEGPYGAMVVLAAKPNQQHKHWSEYIFRMCVSYRKINAFTRPFQFYVARCDDAVEWIGESLFFITLDLDAGYWQVKLHALSKEKTAFFIPDGKRHWNVMPMGILNAHAFFVCMTMQMKDEWDKKFAEDPAAAIARLKQVAKRRRSFLKEMEHGEMIEQLLEEHSAEALKTSNPGSAVIVDDLMLHDRNAVSLLAYFLCVLEVLVHYRVTINLRKGRFLPSRAEFVGVDVLPEGNSPAQSKYGPIEKLCAPERFTDIRAIIGLLGFYSAWLPHFEAEITLWRGVLALQVNAVMNEQQERDLVAKHWTKDCEEALDRLKKALISGPVLKRPNPKRRFYLKTDWSKIAMGGCLLQPEVTEEAEESMINEATGRG